MKLIVEGNRRRRPTDLWLEPTQWGNCGKRLAFVKGIQYVDEGSVNGKSGETVKAFKEQKFSKA